MTATPKLQPNHALDLFEKYLAAHNKSPNTICVYRYAVEQFYHLYPQLTPRNLQLYKVYLLEHYKPQTVNLRIRALNCFMEYRQASITPVSYTHLDVYKRQVAVWASMQIIFPRDTISGWN